MNMIGKPRHAEKALAVGLRQPRAMESFIRALLYSIRDSPYKI
jgi:hypothetical protein